MVHFSLSDMAMIDILYNQDIDLGVGRETYDPNLRKEQEKNRELELEKEHEQERLELERRQREDEELQRQYQGNYTFITDGETGESIAVPVSSLPENVQLQQQEQLQQQQLQMQMQPQLQDMSTPMEANETSLDEAMRILQEGSDTPMDFLPDPASNLTSQQLEDQLQVLLQQQQQLENQHLNSSLIVPEQPQQQQLQLQQQQQQQQHQLLQLQQQQQQQQMSPQLSPQINFTEPVNFQRSWQNMLNFNSTSDNNTTMMGDVAMTNNTNNGLIQNATLVQSNVNVTDFGFSQDLGVNTTGGFGPFFTNGSTPTGGVFPSVPPSNSTLPSNETTLLNIDNRDLIFPNVTGVGSANSTFNESENLLQELLEDDLGDIDLTDLVIAEGIQGIQVVDEASSDSAVSSMGSSGCGMQDFSDMQSSPFDGIEGATGYSQTSAVKLEPKYEKYDPGYHDPQTQIESGALQTNQSSNETHFDREESATANPQHVRHNHSYPLKPGQEPRERKMTEEEKFEASLCRDEKRIKSLNIPFSCHDIIHSPVERFNDMLTKYKLSEKQLQMIRDVRRRGKNKVAAQNCRKRKMEVIQTVEDELQSLRDEKERLIKERGTIDKEAVDYRKMYESIHREVFQALRDDNGHPYDPSEFSLQQTSDGDVFIVPRNTTTRPAEGNHKEKTNRKRKGGRKGT